MRTETFARDVVIVPVVDGATEIIPRLADDGWWRWQGDEGYRGRVHTYREGGIVNVLLTEDGRQEIFAPGLVEVDREQVGKELRLTFRPQAAAKPPARRPSSGTKRAAK